MRFSTAPRLSWTAVALAAIWLLGGCTQLVKPEAEPYFAETPPPPKQEFRWSNGPAPRSLDPAKAAAAPETDIARALYEGLTELDPVTLSEIPAAAEKWEASDDHRTWRFFIRKDAVWTNDKPVTAHDFVRSWRRLGDPAVSSAHRDLLVNIKGLGTSTSLLKARSESSTSTSDAPANSNTVSTPPPSARAAAPAPPVVGEGLVAENDHVLRVDLVHPDKDFPKLVAHPIFRPVFDAKEPGSVTNGPFRLLSIGPEGVVLDRSDTYWDKATVRLERIEFVAAENSEKALEAYRAGRVDAVTNAQFSPAALKLLEPFDDFRRITHSAINVYDVNVARPPFNDRRVRQALAFAIEREKLTEGELQGTTRPAATFLPQGTAKEGRLSLDVEKARTLLEEAGYSGGQGFPTIKLVVNRNEAQIRVARAVAKMWEANLGVRTDVQPKDAAELSAARASGDFDLIRRGVVLPTADETASLLSIFSAEAAAASTHEPVHSPAEQSHVGEPDPSRTPPPPPSRATLTAPTPSPAPILTEDEALYQLNVIPLYFPTSYSLVKPYVSGFDPNSLDAPSLKRVQIDPNWRTRK